MANTNPTQARVNDGLRGGAAYAVQTLAAVDAATTDVDNVALFTKFVKKAEDTAQAAV